MSCDTSSWLRQDQEDWLIGDWTVAEAYRADYTPRPARKIETASAYARIVVKKLGIRKATRLDWALAEAGWNLLPPRELVRRWDEWGNYWHEIQERPGRLGSPYTCEPSWTARAWMLGLKREHYPKALAAWLPSKWPGNRRRVRAIMRLSGKLRSREPLVHGPCPLKSVELKRLSSLSGAFLRAYWEDLLVIAETEGTVTQTPAFQRLLREWGFLQEVRPVLQRLMVPARGWLEWFRTLSHAQRRLVAEGTLVPHIPSRTCWPYGTYTLDKREVIRPEEAVDKVRYGHTNNLVALDSGKIVMFSQFHIDQAPPATDYIEKVVAQYRKNDGPLPPVKTTKDLFSVLKETQRQQEIRRQRAERRRGEDPLAYSFINGIPHHLWVRYDEMLTRKAGFHKWDPEDGSAIGWRGWTRGGLSEAALTSPAQGTIWAGPVLVAEEMYPSGRVRGVSGIHACWTPWSGEMREIAWGEVRGYGKIVSGPEGWRAEECVIVRIFLCPGSVWKRADIAALEDRYGVPVQFAELPTNLNEAMWLQCTSQ